MRNQTDLMREILTDETAQRIIDFVAPIYGNSYVGLWIYQVIGVMLGEIYGLSEKLQNEGSVSTTELLLDQWEDHYKIPRDSSLTPEERRNRILSKIQSRGPCSPARMKSALSSMMNANNVDIEENVDKNKFLVEIEGLYDNLMQAISFIERTKPAHLLYRIQSNFEAEQDLKIANAITHAESHTLGAECVFYETVEAESVPASVITHAEYFTVEVFS